MCIKAKLSHQKTNFTKAMVVIKSTTQARRGNGILNWCHVAITIVIAGLCVVKNSNG